MINCASKEEWWEDAPRITESEIAERLAAEGLIQMPTGELSMFVRERVNVTGESVSESLLKDREIEK